MVEPVRVGILHRVGIVDAVDLRGLHDAIDVQLAGAQGRRRIGREIGIARAGRQNDDAPLLQMADRSAANVGLGHFLHIDGALHAGEDAVALEGVLQSERIHHRGQHADVIGLGAIHALGRSGQAAEDVAPADNHSQLHAIVNDLGDLLGKVIDHSRVNAVPLIAGERLAR